MILSNTFKNLTSKHGKHSVDCVALPPILAEVSWAQSNIQAISILNMLAAPFTFLSNLLVLVAVCKFRKLQTLPNILLANLSMTDMFTGLLMQPCFGVYHILTTQGNSSCLLQTVSNCFAYYFASVSYLTIICIWTERYFAIFHPYYYMKWITKELLVKLLIGLWIFCFVYYGIFLLLRIGIEENRALVALIVPVTFLWSLFVQLKVIIAVRKVRHQVSILPGNQVRRSSFYYYSSNATKVSFLILLTMMICYMPFCVLCLFKYSEWRRKNRQSLSLYVNFQWSIFFVSFNSLCNVVIYCYRLRELRKYIVSMVFKLFENQTLQR